MTTSLRHGGPERDGINPVAVWTDRYQPRAERRRPHSPRPSPIRASRVLRDLLAANAGVETFTVEHIVKSLEDRSTAATLMLFSIPAIAPVPGTTGMVGAPTISISGSLIAGRQTVRLPRKLLAQSIPRRSLALAIHAVLPILERVERVTKERWSWLSTPTAHRIIGILVFLLALPLTFPILGFGLPHAASLFTIALGMIERDGLLVALGIVAGVASLVFVTARELSPDALTRKLASLIRTFVEGMALARQAATTLAKRIWRWLTVKLLSVPPSTRSKRQGPCPAAKTGAKHGRRFALLHQAAVPSVDLARRARAIA